MGRHSSPPAVFSARKALRFGRVEAAVLLGSLVTSILAGAIGLSHDRAADRLAAGGGCREATVVAASSYNSLRFGTSAVLTYADGTRAFTETLRYNSSTTLVPGKTLTICVDLDEPTTFAAPFNGTGGTSTNLWLRWLIGLSISAAAAAAFIVTLAVHQWRYAEGED